MEVGLVRFRMSFMPADSNWNTAEASPLPSMSNVALSSSGTFSMSKSGTRLLMSSVAFLIRVSVLSPRKSILTSPHSSMVGLLICEATAPSESVMRGT